MAHYKVAIVGAGPSGYFAAQALQNSATEDLKFSIDMIERLPTPWGLVRSGVAPDHPKIKTVAKVFEKVAAINGFRLFANVELGKDLTLEDLTLRYDAVIMATGSSVGKRLGIPGEALANSISAADFVPWYNAHPDFENFAVDLSCETAVVIGAGNVAMDCARMLALDPAELDPTDTSEIAMAALRASNIRKVYIVGRRGPENAAFTSPELRELPKLEHTDVHFDLAMIEAAHQRAIAGAEFGEIEKHLASNLEAMRLIAEHPKSGHERSLELKFLSTPHEIKGDGKVEEIVFKINEMVDGKVVDTGETYSIKCGLVITAIGYEASPIDGITMERGKIANVDGRVEETNIYTVGWAKRGPSGVIGTNKSDAADVIKLLVENLHSPKETGDITEFLQQGHHIIDQSAWERINLREVEKGEPLGKPRVKGTSIHSLLEYSKL
jgi:ferredoxin--NADP+ reductase